MKRAMHGPGFYALIMMDVHALHAPVRRRLPLCRCPVGNTADCDLDVRVAVVLAAVLGAILNCCISSYANHRQKI